MWHALDYVSGLIPTLFNMNCLRDFVIRNERKCQNSVDKMAREVTRSTSPSAAKTKKKVAKKAPPKEAKKKVATHKPKQARQPKKIDAKYVVARAVTLNILDNARYVTEACRCKTIMPAHLKAVAMIQGTIAKNHIGSIPDSIKRTMKGGDPVNASEYYGVDSGAYLDISQVSQLETHMYSDAALARVEMPLKLMGEPMPSMPGMTGGAKKAKVINQHVTKSMIKKALGEATGESVRVNTEAREWMRLCAEEHVKELVRRVGDGEKFTIEKVQELVYSESCFAHLRGRV